jgi:hypothetical protein
MPRDLPTAAVPLAVTLALAATTPCAASPGGTRAALGRSAATEPAIRPSLAWAMFQLVPSPEWLVEQGTVRFGLRWQVTPLLYSFGIHRKLSPWRSFIAEPLVRHAGSLELFGSPEYIAGGPSSGGNWLLRGGVRAYFPLVQRGDYLSCSLGGSALHFRGEPAASYEAGLYTFFGVLGVQVTYTPAPALRSTTLTLSLHYF